MAIEISPASEPVLNITRVFNAPRDLVYKAWTDPVHVVNWWGPKGFTTTTFEMDVRPGGVWRYMMHGPDGTDYPNRMVYKVVQPPERLEYTHDGDDDSSSSFQVTVTFAAVGSQTVVTMQTLFATIEERNAVLGYAIPGAKEAHDRLDAYLTTMVS